MAYVTSGYCNCCLNWCVNQITIDEEYRYTNDKFFWEVSKENYCLYITYEGIESSGYSSREQYLLHCVEQGNINSTTNKGTVNQYIERDSLMNYSDTLAHASSGEALTRSDFDDFLTTNTVTPINFFAPGVAEDTSKHNATLGGDIYTNIPIFNINDTENISDYIENGNTPSTPYNGVWTIKTDGEIGKAQRVQLQWGFPDIREEDKESLYVHVYMSGGFPSFTTSSLVWSGSYTDDFPNFYLGDLTTSSGYFPIYTTKNIVYLLFYVTDSRLVGSLKFSQMYAKLQPSHEWGFVTNNGTNESVVFESGAINPSENEDSDNDNNDDGNHDSNGGDNPISGVGALTESYVMTFARLQQLGKFLWDSSFYDNIKLMNNSPIENIVSCKMFTFDIGSGSDSEIVLGNVKTGVYGSKVLQNYTKKITICEGVIVPRFYSGSNYQADFLDYSPYTKISIYLPFVGFKTLDTDAWIGTNISIYFVFDIITGCGKYLLYLNGLYYQSFDCQCGSDVPISGQNRAQVESGYITSALGTITSFASGNVLGGVGSVLHGASNKYHTETHGNYSPICGSYEPMSAMLIIDRPQYSNLKSFNHSHGRMCNLTRDIKNISGFTKIAKEVDLSGVSATQRELEELKEILTSGFYASTT